MYVFRLWHPTTAKLSISSCRPYGRGVFGCPVAHTAKNKDCFAGLFTGLKSEKILLFLFLLTASFSRFRGRLSSFRFSINPPEEFPLPTPSPSMDSQSLSTRAYAYSFIVFSYRFFVNFGSRCGIIYMSANSSSKKNGEKNVKRSYRFYRLSFRFLFF